MIKIQPQYLTLSRLLDKRLFRIPEYQRAYSWEGAQRKDLFSDIVKAHKSGRDGGHFMAAVVCLRREYKVLGTDEYSVLEVVDGQQRLTTLVILLKAVELALDSDFESQAKSKREIQELLVKPEGDDLLLLQTNHDSSHYYADFMRSGKITASKEARTIADRQILNAITECNKFVAAWKDEVGELNDLVSILKNRLYFLLHEIEDERAVYTVFEVLNSRGLDVSWLDRLKSILMGNAYELELADNDQLIKDLHVTWKDIYRTIGLRQGLNTESLRFAATLYSKPMPSKPMGEEASVEQLRRTNGGKDVRSAASWLLSVTNACDKVHSNNRMNAVTRIVQARLLAVAIQLRDDISDKDRQQLLDCWEKVSFRIYGMLEKDARTRVGEYVRLAWRIINENLDSEKIEAEIESIGNGFSIQDATERLRNENCYHGWEENLRYLLFRYEEYQCRVRGLGLSSEQWEKVWQASASDSIEHILPQSRCPESLKHRLGNLVLLTPKLNSTLQAKDPASKAEAYKTTGMAIAIDVADRIEAEGWGEKQILDREEAILDWATKVWG